MERPSISRLSGLLKLRTAIPSQYGLTVYSGWCRKLLEIEQSFTLDMAGDPEKNEIHDAQET